ncbi:mechanosensitive ion channel [Psychrobacter sp. HD31]|uniref:mechanosensitive ion channel n=1 Tax=Psychrobacter sp. HD31 TaxID=3112003 RepID=UPI003DA4381B
MNMNNIFAWFNQNLNGPAGSVIGAILFFVIGWIIALILAAVVRKMLGSVNVNQRMNSATNQQYDIEGIVAKIVFWFAFMLAIATALEQLNLQSISAPFANMINQVLSFVPSIIGAAAIGLIGWVIATVIRNLITVALSKTTMDEKLTAQAGVQPMSNTIADVIYWFILLLVLTLVLNQLGMTSLLEPLNGMIAKITGFLPNALLAAFTFFVGYIAAKILRGITTNLVAATNVQSLVSKAGVSEKTSLPNLAGSAVFLVVVLTALVMALNTLKVDVIARPATNMIDKMMGAIPNILMAVVVLTAFYFISKLIADLVKGLLVNTEVNSLPSKLGIISDDECSCQLTDLIGNAIVFFAMLFGVILAADLLGFDQISEMVTMFINFGADVILGAIIMVIGFWLANLVAGFVSNSEQGSTFLANTVRVLIMGLVIAMGLKAMGIADSIVNLAFGLTLGAVAVAFALSFGLGGQEAAARYLRNLQDKMDNDK